MSSRKKNRMSRSKTKRRIKTNVKKENIDKINIKIKTLCIGEIGWDEDIFNIVINNKHWNPNGFNLQTPNVLIKKIKDFFHKIENKENGAIKDGELDDWFIVHEKKILDF